MICEETVQSQTCWNNDSIVTDLSQSWPQLVIPCSMCVGWSDVCGVDERWNAVGCRSCASQPPAHKRMNIRQVIILKLEGLLHPNMRIISILSFVQACFVCARAHNPSNTASQKNIFTTVHVSLRYRQQSFLSLTKPILRSWKAYMMSFLSLHYHQLINLEI